MSQLAVIVGYGGISPAGRSSNNQAFNRIIFDKLDRASQQETLLDLAMLTGLGTFKNGSYQDATGSELNASELSAKLEKELLNRTLIRKIPTEQFDANAVLMNKPARISETDSPINFRLRSRLLPDNIPDNWRITPLDGGLVDVSVRGGTEVIFPDTRRLPVQSAGTLPSGFEPGNLYQSRNHPRALQMAVYAASDALAATGLDIDALLQSLAPDQIAVFASNSIGQLDELGFGGLTKYPPLGKRTTSKQMPLGYAQMPADFVNAYMLGNLGTTGGALGACATFLYNLRSGVEAIRTGKAELVLVGGSDAPVIPEVIEGFRAMGALAEDKKLQALDGLSSVEQVDHRRACRPFGDNCGFTIGESAQFIVLMSDRLAIETGANIYASVPDVYVNADGYKKSISAPGVGNYLTLGKAAALIEKLVGTESLRRHSVVQAHGTSTPQNRVTESHVLNEIAKAFSIDKLNVSAVKAYLGHSQGTAGGDQILSTLGIWAKGVIPGLITTPAIAEDVYCSNLNLSLEHQEVGGENVHAAMINSKGFGGNNASAAMISPVRTMKMLRRRYSAAEMSAWQARNELINEKISAYNTACLRDQSRPTYRYDYQVLEGEDLQISAAGIKLPQHPIDISFDVDNPYSDLS
ncbi:MAG TPA: beta-ketoacyl synthase [Marinobacterium sp.]|nr:beta-ketoacyl synthase [Marinobacterium sp.]